MDLCKLKIGLEIVKNSPMKEKGVFDVVNTTPRRSFIVEIINSQTYAQAFFKFWHSQENSLFSRLEKNISQKSTYHHKFEWTVQNYLGKIALFGMQHNLKMPSKKEPTNQTFFSSKLLFCFDSLHQCSNTLMYTFQPMQKNCVSRCRYYTTLQTYFC